ncbi:MAG: hypothetical protein AAF557_05680 [Pseudomonadota bacterium]
MKTALIAALLAACATVAYAACPVPADLDSGIKIEDRAGGVGYYKRRPNGLIREDYDIEEEEGYWVESVLGVYLTRDGNLKFGEEEPATESRFNHAVPLDQLPVPAEGVTWNGEVTLSRQGKPDEIERKTMSVGPETTLTIGKCTYKSFLVTMITDFADGTDLVGQMHYMPEMGFSFYSGYGSRKDWLTDYYVPRSIEAVAR